MPFFLLIFYILSEIALFVWIGGVLGVGGVLAEVIGSFFLGLYLLRVLADNSRNIFRDLQAGIRSPKVDPKFHLLASGIALMIPGFLTDMLGLLLLIAPVRRALFRGKDRYFTVRGGASQPYRRDDPNGVIEGEVLDDEIR